METAQKHTVLKRLRSSCNNCANCDLHNSATNKVFGVGPIDSSVMLIGEAPGKDEDESGKPFVGKAGKQLTNLLCFSGLLREKCYITNVCKCRPPRNRKPIEDEVEACREFLLPQIHTVSPTVIVAIGAVCHSALGIEDEVKDVHGKAVYSSTLNTDVFCTYHPAFAIYKPEALPTLEQDFASLGEYCNSMGIGKLYDAKVCRYTREFIKEHDVSSIQIHPGGFSLSDQDNVKLIDDFICMCLRDLYKFKKKHISRLKRSLVISTLDKHGIYAAFSQVVVRRLFRHEVVLDSLTKLPNSKSLQDYIKNVGLEDAE